MNSNIYTDTVLIRYNILLCALLVLNVPSWTYLLYEFIDEQRRKKYGIFFILIICIILVVLCICLGTLVGRGVYLTNHYGFTKTGEFEISVLNHLLQIAMSTAFLLISWLMIFRIKKRRKEHAAEKSLNKGGQP